MKNSGFQTYLNHYSLDHQYQYSLPLQCHYLIKYIPYEKMNLILGIVLCYQYQLMIWLCISLSFWNNRIPCTFLLCCFLQDEGYEDKQKVFSVEHRSYPKLSYPECDLFHPKTDLFSTCALIWVHFTTVHYFSQPIFSLFLYLKNS